ncbi:MAG: putative Co/Zn/Cd efflux system rane fusion protein [Gemmataceae bacterium]|nr:putative Co/Zn/Cd efflux system rane fusion protein [Gemmataceae bacterium]
MHNRTAVGVCCLGVLMAGLGGGCRKGAAPPPSSGPQTIPVSRPVQREVTEFVDYTGRTDAVNSVGVRARVTGYLERLPFKEGAEVKKDDILFEIDPRPYEAMVDQAKAQVGLAEAGLKLAKANFERARVGFEKGAVSQQEVDQAKAAVEQADAQIRANKANLEAAQLNLEFTKYRSPIDGQVSRYYFTPGNLINQDQTLITTVVSVDPMYAYFDVDERTVLRIRKAINEGKIKPRDISHRLAVLHGVAPVWATLATEPDIPVFMALDGEDGYPHRGQVDFVNNVVNPSTATMAVRGVYPNPMPPSGRRLFSPGMFVRIHLPIGQPYRALLVVDRAIGSDQGLKYVYVIDAEHKAQYRRVVIGPLQDDGLRVIEPFDPAAGTGIKPDDWVVVGSLQQIRPKMEVEPEPVPMPTPGAPSQGSPGQTPAPQPGTTPGPQPGANPPPNTGSPPGPKK